MGRPLGRPKKNAVVEPGLDAPVLPFSLQNFVKSMAKDKPDSEIQLLGESDGINSSFSVPYWIPTGLLGLDYVLGGGIAGGRVYEIFSNSPSEGKSAVCALIAAATQRAGGVALLIDTESGTLVERLETLGVDTKDLIISQPDCLEQVFDVMHTFIEEIRAQGFTGPVVIVFDSVAATPTKSQNEAAYDKDLYAPQARVLSSGLRKLMPVLRDNGAVLVAANQVRENIGISFGDSKSTVGGLGLKFFAHVRIALARLSNNKLSSGEITGIEIQALAKKNKLTRPFKKTVFTLNFKDGFDFIGSEFNFAVEKGEIVENKQGYYSFKDNMEKKFRASAYGEHRTEEFTEKLKSMVKL
jgi:recombination protein RecA